MKSWFLLAVLWFAFVVVVEYFLTGFNDDVHDRLAGQIAGYGVVLFVVCGFFRRRVS